MTVQICSGRELWCSYGTAFSSTLWPSHTYGLLQKVDFSESFRSNIHYFSGSDSQKSKLKSLHIYYSPQIDFIPMEVFSEFPNINGLYLYQSNLSSTIRSELFTKDFEKIEYLGVYRCEIETIDESAFKNLVNLKWIRLGANDIKSLPYLIFKANPNLLYIDINSNKIISISPDFFKSLSNLKFIESEGNDCIKKNLGCDTCSISQSDIDSGFSTCFSNCLNNQDDCLTKSKLSQNTSDFRMDSEKQILVQS
jgi:Leucine-rich repeat (LRR) protein